MGDFLCPFCSSDLFHKSGFRNGRQKYKCHQCSKTVLAYYGLRKQYKYKKKSNDKPQHKQIISFDFEEDIWDMRTLSTSYSANEIKFILCFNQIKLTWFKVIVKKYLKQELINEAAFGTVHKKLQTLNLLSTFLKEKKVDSLDNLTRTIVLDFISQISKGKVSSTISNHLSHLRHFFQLGNLHGWFQVSEHLIRDEDYPKWKKGKPKDIPSKVLKQIENNLYKLPDPIARMWMVGFFCAMRISELQLCSLDCINQDSRGRWFITFYRNKNKDHHSLPISRELAQIIQQQQQYIKQQFGNEFNYLFCDYVGISKTDVNQVNLSPLSRVSRYFILSRCINCLITGENIIDDNNQLWHFTNHQLRDTRLTYLFETGHEFTVVSKWAGHKNLENTQKYVHVKDRTLRNETAPIQTALLNIRGKPLNPKDLPATLQTNPNAHTLAVPDDHINTPIYGYCGLSLDQDCPHWKACYTCPSFVAHRELLPDYIQVRNLLRDKQARAEEKGETALIDQFKQQADSLDTIIASFERVA